MPIDLLADDQDILKEDGVDLLAEDMGQTAPKVTEESGFMGGIGESISKRGENIARQWTDTESQLYPGEKERVTESFTKSPGRILRTAGQIAGGIGDVIVEGMKSAYENFVPEANRAVLPGALQKIGSAIAPEGTGERFAENVGTLRDAYRKIKEKFPEGIGNVEALANIASVAPVGWMGAKTISGVAKAGEIASPYLRATGELVGDVAESITRKSPELIEKAIDDAIDKGFKKGIKPSVVGKKDAASTEKFYDNARTATRDIVQAMPDAIPASVEDFSKSVRQVKKNLWESASTMAGEAGAEGALVDLRPVIKDMRTAAADNNLMRANPEAAKKLLQTADEWEGLPLNISPSEAEDLLAQLNSKTKGFWKNPDWNKANEALFAERAARIVRDQTDKAVEAYKGPGWQDFRKRYGAQTAIEKAVTDRANVAARANVKGFFDLTDVFTTGEFVSALMTLNPAQLARASAMYSAKRYIKSQNNVDNIIKGMFGDVKKLTDKKTPKASRWKPEPPDRSGSMPNPLSLPMPERGFTLSGEPYGEVLRRVKPSGVTGDVVDAEYTAYKRKMLNQPKREEVLQLTGQGFELPRGVWAMKSNAKMKEAFANTSLANMTEQELLEWLTQNARR